MMKAALVNLTLPPNMEMAGKTKTSLEEETLNFLREREKLMTATILEEIILILIANKNWLNSQ